MLPDNTCRGILAAMPIHQPEHPSDLRWGMLVWFQTGNQWHT